MKQALGGTLGIVGGGSVATAYLHHLVQALGEAAAAGQPPGLQQVRVYEPQRRVGRGTAYADDLPSNLLNVTVAGMSALGDDKLHFQRWLAAEGITHFGGAPIGSGSFVSRALFGRYLEAVQAESVAAARTLGVTVVHVPTEVTAMTPAAGGGWQLRGADGSTSHASHVVLSLGNPPATALAALRGRPHYAHSPYPTAALAQVPPQAEVGIVGTGLSAVDAIVALAAQGHRGRITALSRQGRLPCVRSVHPSALALGADFQHWLQQCWHRRQHGETVPLDTLAARLHADFTAQAGRADEDLAALAREVPPALDFLDAEITRASTQARPWQTFGNLLNACIDRLWHLLSDADRERFEREIRPVWMARRVSLPLENALILQRLLRQGQLQVCGGFAAATALPAAGFELRWTQDATAQARRVDVLINATGFSTRAEGAELPLLRQLLGSGLAVHHPFGGLRLDFDSGALIDAAGRVQPSVTVLGSMAAGTYFWTNAMEVNARLAMVQARSLVAQGLALQPQPA
jgi:uncharacterized NAD(P)/FAD-binding protein YdhS